MSSSRTAGRNPWLGVELRHLAALVAVVREGSFRGAAEALGYAQSTVSQQIAQLERVSGRRLVSRRRGTAPVLLTAAGERLLPHAEEIIARFGSAHLDLVALDCGPTRALRVGCFESAATRLIPRILAALRRRAPDVRVRATEADHCSELLEQVQQGALDATFCRTPEIDATFASVRLLPDPIVLIVAAGSELGRRPEPPGPAELCGLDLIEHPMMSELEPRLRSAGVFPRYGFGSERNAAVHALVAAGVGAAIMPALAVDPLDPRLTIHPLGRLVAPSAIRLAWRRGSRVSHGLRTFLELARRTADAVDAEMAGRGALAPAAA
jgi:DNA-binding transcriptional LysR family regulator